LPHPKESNQNRIKKGEAKKKERKKGEATTTFIGGI
jgi:hypothetical protein